MRYDSLFEGDRLSMNDAITMSLASLREYSTRYHHWAMAYSGGKDSSAAVTFVVNAIESGEIARPTSLTVLYADTRMEMPPLHAAAMNTLRALRARGIDARVVLPELDDRFFVYMFGRGVPPPKNRFRWCTSQIKIEPMLAALQDLRALAGEKLLMITGVRLGESAARDERIITSCSRDGPVDEPVATVSAQGTHIGEVRAFLLKYFGTDQDPRLEEPLHTVSTRDRFALVMVKGQPYVIVDIGMRMLTPRELFRAQGFPETYIIDRGIDPETGQMVRLTKTAQVKMCGNSVSPPPAEALVRAQFTDSAREAAA